MWLKPPRGIFSFLRQHTTDLLDNVVFTIESSSNNNNSSIRSASSGGNQHEGKRIPQDRSDFPKKSRQLSCDVDSIDTEIVYSNLSESDGDEILTERLDSLKAHVGFNANANSSTHSSNHNKGITAAANTTTTLNINSKLNPFSDTDGVVAHESGHHHPQQAKEFNIYTPVDSRENIGASQEEKEKQQRVEQENKVHCNNPYFYDHQSGHESEPHNIPPVVPFNTIVIYTNESESEADCNNQSQHQNGGFLFDYYPAIFDGSRQNPVRKATIRSELQQITLHRTHTIYTGGRSSSAASSDPNINYKNYLKRYHTTKSV